MWRRSVARDLRRTRRPGPRKHASADRPLPGGHTVWLRPGFVHRLRPVGSRLHGALSKCTPLAALRGSGHLSAVLASVPFPNSMGVVGRRACGATDRRAPKAAAGRVPWRREELTTGALLGSSPSAYCRRVMTSRAPSCSPADLRHRPLIRERLTTAIVSLVRHGGPYDPSQRIRPVNEGAYAHLVP